MAQIDRAELFIFYNWFKLYAHSEVLMWGPFRNIDDLEKLLWGWEFWVTDVL